MLFSSLFQSQVEYDTGTCGLLCLFCLFVTDNNSFINCYQYIDCIFLCRITHTILNQMSPQSCIVLDLMTMLGSWHQNHLTKVFPVQLVKAGLICGFDQLLVSLQVGLVLLQGPTICSPFLFTDYFNCGYTKLPHFWGTLDGFKLVLCHFPCSSHRLGQSSWSMMIYFSFWFSF